MELLKTDETLCEEVKEVNAEKQSVEEDITESTFTQITDRASPMEIKQEKHDGSLDSVTETEKGDSEDMKEEKVYSVASPELSSVLQLSAEMWDDDNVGASMKEGSRDESSGNVNTQASGELSIKVEDTSNSSEESLLNVTENIKSEPESLEGAVSKSLEEKGTLEVPADNGGNANTDVKQELQSSFPSVEENESSNDTSVCDSNTSAELREEQTDSLEVVAVAPEIETNTSVGSKPPDSTVHRIKTSKGPKIKRTLSRAERLSRVRKAKGGLTLKMGYKVSPLKVSPPSKQADTSGGSLDPKGAAPVKASVKNEKTVQRRRSAKGSRSSSISPRGYGYSMAFMDMEKPGPPVVKTDRETDVSLPESGLTTVSISIPSSTSNETSPTSPASSTGTPTENPPAPKNPKFQAKKFRLDQITGKLSAQRQSEAKAAAHSPSAFQRAKHHSSPPPPPTLTPSPPANPPPPYPRESYPPRGPPPLIYSPMPGSICPPPHHQHMYGPHPTHGMHLPAGHMHPLPEYPPPTSGYMLYAHGMHYPPPPGPCIGQCKSN